MLPFKKILLPVDYSAPCSAILPVVEDTLRHFKAELTLVHAYGLFNYGYGDLLLPAAELPHRVHKFEEQRLKEFAAEGFPGRHVEIRAADGEPGSVIRDVVKSEGTDLVMMPTQGKGPVRRFLVGSTTSKVLHDVSAAVWTGSPEALAAHKTPIRSILCAVDETSESEAVVRAAACLASSYDASLSLIHVVRIPPTAYEIDFFTYQPEMIAAAESAICRMKAKVGIEAPHTVVSSFSLDPIREEAIARKADLLVVGRGHQQERLGRLWSDLYQVIRDAPCPVLSI